jgi:hypothetical protein
MKSRTWWIAGLAAVFVLLMAAATVLAYTGQVAGSVAIAGQDAACGTTVTVTATFVDAAGTPVTGESVVWSFATSPSPSDVINETPTMTDAQGLATTTVTLAPVAGTREIRATAGDVAASAILDPPCGGLPNTSTMPAESPGGGVPLTGALLAVLAFCVGGWLSLRRFAATRA